MIGWLLTLLSRRRKKKLIIKHPLHLPRQVLGKIIRCLSYQEIALLRRVDRLCARVCSRILNSEWDHIQNVLFQLTENPNENYQAASLLSRTNNGRFYKAAQLVLIEIKMLNVYFKRHLKNSNSAFYPGYLLDLLSHFVKTIETITRQSDGDHINYPANHLHILVNRISLVSEVVIQYHEKNLETIKNRKRFFGAIILETIRAGFEGVQKSLPLFPPASSMSEEHLMDYMRVLRLEIRRRSRNLVINSVSNDENENTNTSKMPEILETPMIPISVAQNNELLNDTNEVIQNEEMNEDITLNKDIEQDCSEVLSDIDEENEQKSSLKSKVIKSSQNGSKKSSNIWVRESNQNTYNLSNNQENLNEVHFLRPRISKSTPKDFKLKKSSELKNNLFKKSSINRYFKGKKSKRSNKKAASSVKITKSIESNLKRIDGSLSIALSHDSSSIEPNQEEEIFYKTLNDNDSFLTPSTQISVESLELKVPPQWTNCNG